MTERFVYTTGTISIANGASSVTGSGTAWSGQDRGGAQIWALPADGEPFLVGVIAEVDPRGVYENLELPLVAPYEGETLAGSDYMLLAGPALANGATQAAIYARFTAFLEENMGLTGNLADQIDWALIPNNSLFIDAVTRQVLQWRNGVLEAVHVIGAAFNPRGEWNDIDSFARNDLVSHGGLAYVSNVDENVDNEPDGADEFWTPVAVIGAEGAGFYPVDGAPDNGFGRNGDHAVDIATGVLYAKAGGEWAPTGETFLDPALLTVAGIATEIEAVAAIVSAVTAVAAISSDIETLAALDTAVSTLAALDAELAALGPIAAAISGVDAISAEITAVAGMSANIETVAGLDTEIAALGAISGAISVVAGISEDITTLAGKVAEIEEVAGAIEDIEAVAGNLEAILAAAGHAEDAANSALEAAAAAAPIVTVIQDETALTGGWVLVADYHMPADMERLRLELLLGDGSITLYFEHDDEPLSGPYVVSDADPVVIDAEGGPELEAGSRVTAYAVANSMAGPWSLLVQMDGRP